MGDAQAEETVETPSSLSVAGSLQETMLKYGAKE